MPPPSVTCFTLIKVGSSSFKPILNVGVLLDKFANSAQVDCTNPCNASLIFFVLDLVIGPFGTCMGSLRGSDRNLQGGRDRRRRVPSVENEYENEGDDDDGEYIASEVGIGGVGRPRGGRRGRQPSRNPRCRDGVDRNIGSIKMKIPSFQGKNDSESNLEWEKKIELIFYHQNYSEEKKVKLAIIKFNDYLVGSIIDQE
jgi:hypothetical protein